MVRLLPQDEGFFALFERVAEQVHDAGRLLGALLRDLADAPAVSRRLDELERAGDEVTREAIAKLNRTFLAPFDREEIHALVCRMDDVLDHVAEAASRVALYRVERPTADATALGAIVEAATALLRALVPLLRELGKPRPLLELCHRIQEQKAAADRLEQRGVAALFEGGGAPVEILKWKDVYADLERAAASCADVANVVEAIVIRHS